MNALPAFEITGFKKSGGPLTKRISLGVDGTPKSDGSACVMSRGSARRLRFTSITEFAQFIGNISSSEAIALGVLRHGLPDQVEIVTKAKLEELDGSAAPNVIARMAREICYRPKQPALALLDFDTKGMPNDVKERIDELGSFWSAAASVVPALGNVARVMRRSTSAGLIRTDTGEHFAGSGGLHVYLPVQDGADIERFLKTLHDRCWLAGLGWMMVGAGGQLLERSIVDRMVGAPERLVFEGTPVVEPPLAQDQESRRPIVDDGEAVDSVASCPPLTIVERAKLRGLRAKAVHHLAGESAKAREAFVKDQAKRHGVAPEVIEQQCRGVLLPSIVLPFDEPELAGTTVAKVLADPARYEGETLADPLEGVGYGRCKARVMLRPDGTPWIHSFAHGRTVYDLKQDAAAVRAAIIKAEKDQAVTVFVRLALRADLADDEEEDLRNLAAERAGVGKRAIERRLNAARQERARQHAREEDDHRIAERRDPRPQLPAPADKAEWLPQIQAIDEVLSNVTALEPPMRDDEGFVVAVHVRRVRGTHLLTSRGSNNDETDETRLPPPEQPMLYRLGEPELAELIERYIGYVDHRGELVYLPTRFVHHYWQRRNDTALPRVSAIATMPMVLEDGSILAGHGLDRERSIVFRIPPELLALLPKAEDCTPLAVGKALKFLCDDWLVDVAADYEGKCVLIALALTILERIALPERPAFFVTAGQRGGGKTTAVNMVSLCVLGHRAAAAAWSSSEEERRKALFAFLGAGIALIPWDNIPRGAAISCPSIEKALTTETYTDRILGETRYETVPATSVMTFTGNNVTAKGDLASRSLVARLTVNRPDPENRQFNHPDPFTWTEANRGRILQALYTVLLGNPRLRPGYNGPQDETRFKTWYRLIGSAVQFAAEQHAELTAAEAKWLTADCSPPTPISFKSMFLAGEAEEEQSCSLAIVLHVIRTKWPAGASANQISTYAGLADEGAIAFKAALEAASGKAIRVVTSTVITWRLKAIADMAVQDGNAVLVLHYLPDHQGGTFVVRTM